MSALSLHPTKVGPWEELQRDFTPSIGLKVGLAEVEMWSCACDTFWCVTFARSADSLEFHFLDKFCGEIIEKVTVKKSPKFRAVQLFSCEKAIIARVGGDPREWEFVAFTLDGCRMRKSSRFEVQEEEIGTVEGFFCKNGKYLAYGVASDNNNGFDSSSDGSETAVDSDSSSSEDDGDFLDEDKMRVRFQKKVYPSVKVEGNWFGIHNVSGGCVGGDKHPVIVIAKDGVEDDALVVEMVVISTKDADTRRKCKKSTFTAKGMESVGHTHICEDSDGKLRLLIWAPMTKKICEYKETERNSMKFEATRVLTLNVPNVVQIMFSEDDCLARTVDHTIYRCGNFLQF